jgi:D-2-hydroxyacid dehydrogenase (NADP+)
VTRRVCVSVKSINLVVTITLDDTSLRKITDISSRIKLNDASKLARAEQKGDTVARKQLDTLLAEAEVIYGFGLPKSIIARAPKLKWVQMTSAGVERFIDDEFRQSSVIMTNVSGINAIPIAEFVLGLMLMFAKQALLCSELKQHKKWKPFAPGVLRSKTVGIVGLGSIGREVARLAKAFGMRVVATRRSARQSRRARYVDLLYPPGQLLQLLSDSDFVVLAVPLTSETYRFIGERQLRSMKSTAYLINVARGDVIDEDALIRALEEHWIAGAGLDVFAIEPLPPESRFWELPNVILSPHVSGIMEGLIERATSVFCENLRRYLTGRRLLNIVHKERGY